MIVPYIFITLIVCFILFMIFVMATDRSNYKNFIDMLDTAGISYKDKVYGGSKRSHTIEVHDARIDFNEDGYIIDIQVVKEV